MFKLGLPRSSHAETLYPSCRPLVASGRVLVLAESLIPNPPRFTPTAPQSLLPTHLPLLLQDFFLEPLHTCLWNYNFLSSMQVLSSRPNIQLDISTWVSHRQRPKLRPKYACRLVFPRSVNGTSSSGC